MCAAVHRWAGADVGGRRRSMRRGSAHDRRRSNQERWPGRIAGRFGKLAGLAHGPLLLEATAAENRAPLGGLEGNGGLRSAFRADGARFRAHGTGAGSPFGLALLAAFRIVLELLVEKEQLLASRENEVASAVGALENLVDEIHPA